jgi:hypothetical protein
MAFLRVCRSTEASKAFAVSQLFSITVVHLLDVSLDGDNSIGIWHL